MSEGKKTAAVFIDADNCRLTALPSIYECLAPEWDATIRRAYGIGLSQRQEKLRQTGTMPIEVVPNIKGKNATDMVLALDVMEHLYRGNTESIVLVSGDSDFTPLVLKVRESGKPIIVFGNADTPLALRTACTTFHAISEGNGTGAQTASPPSKPAASKNNNTLTHELQRLKGWLEEAFVEFAGKHADTTITRFGGFLKEKDPTFAPKKFGSKRLRSLLQKLGFQLLPIRGTDRKITNYKIALVVPPHVGDAEQALDAAAGTPNTADT